MRKRKSRETIENRETSRSKTKSQLNDSKNFRICLVFNGQMFLVGLLGAIQQEDFGPSEEFLLHQSRQILPRQLRQIPPRFTIPVVCIYCWTCCYIERFCFFFFFLNSLNVIRLPSSILVNFAILRFLRESCFAQLVKLLPLPRSRDF